MIHVYHVFMKNTPLEEDWEVLVSLLPKDWQKLAEETRALKGLRKNKSAADLLRTLLIHLACGYSLRETAVRARHAKLADMSDVALLKRLRKSKDWLAALCFSMFHDRGICLQADSGFEVRLFDATNIKEPGKTGSLWRVHYSVRVPSLRCDFFKVTPVEGKGSGESLKQYSIQNSDYIIADRGYSTASGIEHVTQSNGHILVRMSPHNLEVMDSNGKPMPWKDRLEEITHSGHVCSWPVYVPGAHGKYIPGRICVIRKTEEAIRQAHKSLHRKASKNGQQLRPETLLHAQYVIVFTTFPESRFSATEVMKWYRLRWQIELVFKRFKQIAQLGHLPKHDDESAQAWLYGKLFIAMLAEKLIAQARSFSPWGCSLLEKIASESVA
jgi:hypothetical protein